MTIHWEVGEPSEAKGDKPHSLCRLSRIPELSAFRWGSDVAEQMTK
jgi:hypothetical protein